MDWRDVEREITKIRSEKSARERTRQQPTGDERKKREEEERKAEALDRAAAAFLRASPARISSFQRSIDNYRIEATQALIRNERAQAEIAARIQARLDQAFVLDDGRRVFKTEDGTRVFDEHGVEVGEDEITPDEIPNHLDRWEIMEQELERQDELLEDHQAILDFEAELDAAEEEIEAGGITNERLDELEAELEAAIPASMRPAQDDPGPKTKAQPRPSDRPLPENRSEQQRPFDPLRPGG